MYCPNCKKNTLASTVTKRDGEIRLTAHICTVCKKEIPDLIYGATTYYDDDVVPSKEIRKVRKI